MINQIFEAVPRYRRNQKGVDLQFVLEALTHRLRLGQILLCYGDDFMTFAQFGIVLF